MEPSQQVGELGLSLLPAGDLFRSQTASAQPVVSAQLAFLYVFERSGCARLRRDAPCLPQ